MKIHADPDLIDDLRHLRPLKHSGATLREFPVCASPHSRDLLSEEEYAPYLVAADGKHDSYMRHGAPWAPTDLAWELTIGNLVVAWLPYDGKPRVVERDFGNSGTNRIRDLARKYLGASPDRQQELADLRGDIDRMSASGFRSVIFEHLDRASLGSNFSDFPTDVSVRVFFDQKRREAREKNPANEWPSIPNPTVEYTDDQRGEWAGKAALYLAAFRDQFPRDYTEWTTRQHLHLLSRRADAPTPSVSTGDRVVCRTAQWDYQPAIVTRTREREQESANYAWYRTPLGIEDRLPVRRYNVFTEAELLPETRELHGTAWQQIEADIKAGADDQPASE